VRDKYPNSRLANKNGGGERRTRGLSSGAMKEGEGLLGCSLHEPRSRESRNGLISKLVEGGPGLAKFTIISAMGFESVLSRIRRRIIESEKKSSN